MAQILNIKDDTVVISKLSLQQLEGNVTHTGNLEISGDATVQNDLKVDGVLVVDTLHVKTVVSETKSSLDAGHWISNTEEELAGKGLRWTWGDGETQLIFRAGSRVWTNSDIDISSTSSYKIDNIPVLTINSLGPSITKSNIRQLGPLNSLSVIGDATISEFAYFNSITNRLGLGTDEPSASISILDNDVEISIGSPRVGLATIGTTSNHDLAFVSDNIPRITIKQNGEIHINDEVNKSGVLRVFGTLYADAVISDTRIERTSPIEFKTSQNANIYGNGLTWTGTGSTRYLVMKQGPDRLWSSESIDLGIDQAYYVNGSPVLNEISLGKSVLYSNLIRLGSLESLTVNGNAKFLGELDIESGAIRSKDLMLNDGVNRTTFTPSGIDVGKSLTFSVQNSEAFYVDSSEIVIGNKQSNRRVVKVFGQLTVGVNNPDPSVSLAVNGNISFANRKFITGMNAPTEGMFSKGDICWNQNPQEDGYVGWVCVKEGAPGLWSPFGAIGRHG